jgi:hypothetical protein
VIEPLFAISDGSRVHVRVRPRDILQKVTPSVAGVDESTCFPTLCTWLITHKGELVDVKSIILTDIDLSTTSVNMNHFANVLRNVELASLTHLYLERDQIGDNGMIAFADAIKPTDEIPMGALPTAPAHPREHGRLVITSGMNEGAQEPNARLGHDRIDESCRKWS